jgi:hypothetical protein
MVGLAMVMVALYFWLGSSRRARRAEDEGPIVWRGGRRVLSEDAAKRMVSGPLEKRDRE